MVRTWDKLVFRMTSELVVSKHPVFKCSNIRQVGCIDEAMERRRGWNTLSHVRDHDIGVETTPSVSRSEAVDSEQHFKKATTD